MRPTAPPYRTEAIDGHFLTPLPADPLDPGKEDTVGYRVDRYSSILYGGCRAPDWLINDNNFCKQAPVAGLREDFEEHPCETAMIAVWRDPGCCTACTCASAVNHQCSQNPRCPCECEWISGLSSVFLGKNSTRRSLSASPLSDIPELLQAETQKPRPKCINLHPFLNTRLVHSTTNM